MARRLAVVNFKGGVGKTTLALHLGCFLARRSRASPARVLLIDVDHQSSLSIVVQDADGWERACRDGATIDRVFSSYTTPGASLPGMEIVVGSPFGNRYPSIDIVPARFELDDTEIELAATSIGNPFVSEWRKRTLLCKWLADSGADAAYDFVIFDCPPATKIVSQNAIAASHAYVVPVIPDAVSTRGVTHFVNLVANRIDARLKGFAAAVGVSEVPSTYVPETQLGGIVLSNVQTHGPSASGFINEHTTYMAQLRQHWGEAVLSSLVERGAGVAESLGSGWPVFDRTDEANVTNRGLPQMLSRVCTELMARLGW